MRHNSQGFSSVALLVAIVIVVVGFVGYEVYSTQDTKTTSESSTTNSITPALDSTQYSNSYFSFYFPSSLAVSNNAMEQNGNVTVTGFHKHKAVSLSFVQTAQPKCAGSNESTLESWTCNVKRVVPINNMHFPGAKLVYATQVDTASPTTFHIFYLSNDPNVKAGDSDFVAGLVLDNASVLSASLGTYDDYEVESGVWGNGDKDFFESFQESDDYKKLLHILESLDVKDVYKV